MKDAASPTSTSTSLVTAHVTEAPALGGVPMYELKIACKGHSSTMIKSREDFRSVLNMFKLTHSMARNRGESCVVCTTCSAFSMVRACDAASLDAFLNSVLLALRKLSRDALLECATHRGVVQILMEFLGVNNGKYFSEPEESEMESPEGEHLEVQENDAEHPITSHCALLRSISDQYAAMDSVC